MRTIFHVDFVAQPGDGMQGSARLEVDLPFAPTPDIEFQHPVWHHARKPASVSYDIVESSFYVYFGTDKLQSKEHRKGYADMYHSHGWTVS